MTDLIDQGASKSLSGPITDLYKISKTRISSSFELNRIKNLDIEALYNKLHLIQNVYTIWQIDKKVNLETFYYPAKINVEGVKTVVRNVDQIPSETFKVDVHLSPGGIISRLLRTANPFKFRERVVVRNVLIEGIAGQGKSIFLRYLCAQELKRGEYIPLFIPLHKIGNQSLESLLKKELSILGFTDLDHTYNIILRSGILILFLDGFDEVPNESVAKIINELEAMSDKYRDSLRIVVSSRPNSKIENSTRFAVFRLEKLGGDDFLGVLVKATEDTERAETIVSLLQNSTKDIVELVNTPLMLALLVLVYKSHRKIPETFSEFYGDIFYTLMERHDSTKVGYTRDRECKEFSYRDYLNLFKYFCYLSMESDTKHMHFELAIELIHKASKLAEIKVKPESFLEDICKISNLLIEEGGELYFIHKSVQEYYSARLLKDRGDFTLSFYKGLLDGDLDVDSWRGVIDFLAVEDEYRCHKYFLLPDVARTLTRNGLDPESTFEGLSKESRSRFITGVGHNLNEIPIVHSFNGFGTTDYEYRSDVIKRHVQKSKYLDHCEKMVSFDYQLFRQYKRVVDREERHESAGSFKRLIDTV